MPVIRFTPVKPEIQITPFSKNRPLGRFFLVVAMSVYKYIYIYSIPFSCNSFQGLSLALRSHDQIPASYWAIILLLFTLFPRSKTTHLPLDFEHFTPNIDNFAPIQKGHFALYFHFFSLGGGTGIKLVIKLKVLLSPVCGIFRCLARNLIKMHCKI
jgi:hypothetical protein